MANHSVKEYMSPFNLADSKMTKDFDFSKVSSWVFFRGSAKFNEPGSFLKDTSQLNLTDLGRESAKFNGSGSRVN